MPLSEPLSLRDYFAGQALAALSVRKDIVPNEAAWLAYSVADRMLARREKDGRLRDHEIEGLTRRAETAEVQAELLVNMREAVQICLDAERERRKKLKPGAPATAYTDERIAKLERLLA